MYKKLRNKFKDFQISISNNQKGTIRLHFQLHPFREAKYIACIKGKLFDIIVDIRKKLKNFMIYKYFIRK